MFRVLNCLKICSLVGNFLLGPLCMYKIHEVIVILRANINSRVKLTRCRRYDFESPSVWWRRLPRRWEKVTQLSLKSVQNPTTQTGAMSPTCSFISVYFRLSSQWHTYKRRYVQRESQCSSHGYDSIKWIVLTFGLSMASIKTTRKANSDTTMTHKLKAKHKWLLTKSLHDMYN